MRRPHKSGCIGYLAMPVVETFGNNRTYGDERLERGTLGHCLLYLAEHILLAYADDGFHAGALVAIDNVVLGQHVCGGYDHGAELVESEHRDPPLVAALEDEHHHVAMSDAELSEIGCGLVALALQVGKRREHLGALVVGPDERHLVGLLLGPDVHHVVGKIEVLGNDELQMFVIVFHRLEMSLS